MMRNHKKKMMTMIKNYKSNEELIINADECLVMSFFLALLLPFFLAFFSSFLLSVVFLHFSLAMITVIATTVYSFLVCYLSLFPSISFLPSILIPSFILHTSSSVLS